MPEQTVSNETISVPSGEIIITLTLVGRYIILNLWEIVHHPSSVAFDGYRRCVTKDDS